MSRLDVQRRKLPTGISLEVASRGSGPAGVLAPAIIFMHGYTDSWRSYEMILPRLPDDVHALAISQRGHGESDRPESGYEIKDYAADIIALMDASGIAQATIVGHSMSSLVAQELALSYPDRVSRLVLIGSAPTFDRPEVRELEKMVHALPDPIPREFAREFQVSTIHRPVSAELLEKVTDESMKLPARVWREAVSGLLRFDSSDRLSRVTAPTLIVWGDQDTFVMRTDQDRLRQGIAGARFLCYEGTGHAVHWEEPQRFVDDLMSFVRETKSANVSRGQFKSLSAN